MNEPTDSELQAKWEANRAAIAKLKNKNDPASSDERAQLIRQAEFLEMDWRELVERKRHGVLTDSALVERVIKTAKEHSISSGLQIRFETAEGRKSDTNLPILATIYLTNHLSLLRMLA